MFSLESRRELDDDGVTFRSHIDGSTHRFTPENVVAFETAIGVDIAMVLDECVSLPATTAAIEASVRRTTLWARRARAAWDGGATALFGIVQGGLDERLRAQSASELIDLDFPGYAIGGLSVGESRADMERFTRFTASLLPEQKPRYLMGVGTVRDLIAGVDAGIDMFDCVYPTRSGRHGRALTRTGEYNVRNAAYARDDRPIDPACSCEVCRTYTRAYLSHLFRAEELLGPRLLSYHNLAALTSLMADARDAIAHDRWAAFRDDVLAPIGPLKAPGCPSAHTSRVRSRSWQFPAFVLALGAIALLRPSAALADNPFETTAGVTLNPVVGGVHESFNDTVHLPPIPVPLFELSQRLGPFEIAGYGLPPTVAIPYSDAIQGNTALRLTILDASLRLWGPGRFFAVEAGETVYNQTTHYQTADSSHPLTDERQYSRIAGGHYGLVLHLPFRAGMLETEVKYAPVLLGTQVTTYGDNSPTRFDPERGNQIDAQVRYIHSVGKHAQAILGGRYVNFTASYDVPGHPLSDRNAAFLPSFGYRFTTGP